jgi:preprotein translocase subunit SecA
MEEGVPIEHGMVTKAILRAQTQVEAQNFGVRKHLLEYDDVMNKQRESVYTLRREVLEGSIHLTEEDVVDSKEYILELGQEILQDQIDRFAGKDIEVDDWDTPALVRETSRIFGIDPQQLDALELDQKGPEDMFDAIWALAKASYEEKEQQVTPELLRRVERDIMLQVVDQQWKEHLRDLDHLKEGIGLRGYGQKDPLVEYKKESYTLFTDMKKRIEEEMVRYLFWLRPVANEEALRPAPRRAAPMITNNPGAEANPAFGGIARQSAAAPASAATSARPTPARAGGDDVIKTIRREEPKVGRNDPCPCGSGKKYKKCHGIAA